MRKFGNYYERRQFAQDTVINTVKSLGEVTRAELQVQIAITTGLGKKFLDDFLDLLVAADQIILDGVLVRWHDPLNPVVSKKEKKR